MVIVNFKKEGMVNKESARNVAKMEVERRVVTIQEAKDKVKDWIKETSKGGGFSKEVIEFWEEVSKQVDDL